MPYPFLEDRKRKGRFFLLYTEYFEVLAHDVDPTEVIRPSALQKYLQETANHQMRDCKPSYNELYSEGKAFLLSRIAVECFRPIRQYEQLTVQSWPCPSRGATFPRCYQVRCGEEVVAQASSLWGLLDLHTRKLLRSDSVDLSSYAFGEPLAVDSLRFRLPDLPLTEVGNHTTTYAEIDCNRHMNNTNYPDLLMNHLPDPEAQVVCGFSIHYQSEAPYGERLTVQRSEAIEENEQTVYYFRTLRENGEGNIAARVVVQSR